MKITVNKKEIEVDGGATVAQAMEACNIAPEGIAVALNNVVVPKAKLAETTLNEGDSILIIKAFYGG